MKILELYISNYIESIFIIGASLSIINIRIEFKKILALAVLYSIAIFGTRMVYETQQIPLGTHSLVVLALFVLILRFVLKEKWSVAIVASLIPFLLLTVGEGVIMFNIAMLFNITSTEILNKPGFRLLGTMISDIFLIIVFIVGYVFKFSIIDIRRFTEKEEI